MRRATTRSSRFLPDHTIAHLQRVHACSSISRREFPANSRQKGGEVRMCAHSTTNSALPLTAHGCRPRARAAWAEHGRALRTSADGGARRNGGRGARLPFPAFARSLFGLASGAFRPFYVPGYSSTSALPWHAPGSILAARKKYSSTVRHPAQSWDSATDDQGRMYYYHRKTHKTSWTLPSLLRVKGKAGGLAARARARAAAKRCTTADSPPRRPICCCVCSATRVETEYDSRTAGPGRRCLRRKPSGRRAARRRS